MIWPLKNCTPSIPKLNSAGDFGYKRSTYHHTGIDLYCHVNQEIVAIEDGVVVHMEHFTGAKAIPSSPWWNDTWSIMIEGKSGVIGYCELIYDTQLIIGTKIKSGDVIGSIIPVLKKDKGNGIAMLHIEHYISGTHYHVTWDLHKPQPIELLNPRFLLNRNIDK